MDIDYDQEVRQMKTIAALYKKRSKFREAEHIYKTIISLQEKYLGVYSADIALTCYQLAEVYSDLGQYAQARPLFERSVNIWEELGRLQMIKPEDTIYFMDALIELQLRSEAEEGSHESEGSNSESKKRHAA